MELIGSLFLVLALALVVGLFIAQPFITGFKLRDSEAAQAREHQRSALLAERDRVLNALQELDFDNALGKIPAEEYPIQRAALLKTGADTLRRLDEFEASAEEITGGPSSAGAALASRSRSAEDRIEAAVAARRADASQPAVVAAGNGNGHHPAPAGESEALENLIASRKRERKESAGGFCPHCGKPVSKSDKFCSRCGVAL